MSTARFTEPSGHEQQMHALCYTVRQTTGWPCYQIPGRGNEEALELMINKFQRPEDLSDAPVAAPTCAMKIQPLKKKHHSTAAPLK